MYTPVAPDELDVIDRILSIGFRVAPAVMRIGLGIIIPQSMDYSRGLDYVDV